MKRLFFLVLLLSASISIVHAQTEKGSLLLGGTGGINFTDLSDESNLGSTFSFNLMPNIGYFVTDGLALGASVGLGFSSNDVGSANRFSFGPFARYYINIGASSIKPFGTVGINFGRGTNNPDDGEKTSIDFREFQVGAGATYFLTENIGLEAILGYTNTKNTSDFLGIETESTNSNFGLNFGFQIFLGSNK